MDGQIADKKTIKYGIMTAELVILEIKSMRPQDEAIQIHGWRVSRSLYSNQLKYQLKVFET